MDIDKNTIKSNPFFRLLGEQELAKILDHVSVIKLQPNEILFHEGDFSDAFYIVKNGAIQISTINTQGKPIFLARITENGFFGEQAFSPFHSPRRRAKATAQLETTLYKFPRNTLISLEPKLKSLLHEKGSQYIKEKLQKLSSNFKQSFCDINNLMRKDEFYPKHSVIYYQDDSAEHIYIVVRGEIELRQYDTNKKIQQVVDIGPGQMFGTEGLTENSTYTATAIAKIDTSIIVIDSKQYHKISKDYPLLKNLGDDFNNHFTFKAKEKMIQFRSEYLDMPAITSILPLKTGQELICQQIAGGEIFLATITASQTTREIKHFRDEDYNRSLSLNNNKITSMLDYGIWQDTDHFIDLMINEQSLSETQINEFIETGHINSKKIDDSNIICKCMRVTQAEINHLIVSQKADFNKISKLTGAGTICGGCKPLILEMLGENAWTACIISNVISHNSEIKSFQLTPLHNKIVAFTPGQYLIIKTKINDAWVRRSYTVTSLPNQLYYEITVKKENKGLFSSCLFENKDANKIFYVAGPYGQFTLETSQNKPIICFMGGIGITPAIVFTRQLVSSGVPQKIYIDYSAMDAEQFILMDEFAHIEKQHSNVVINHRITNACGNITEQEIKNIISSINDCHIYVCGPKSFEDLIVATVNALNISPARLHIEQFIHAGVPENIAPTITL